MGERRRFGWYGDDVVREIGRFMPHVQYRQTSSDVHAQTLNNAAALGYAQSKASGGLRQGPHADLLDMKVVTMFFTLILLAN
jgi:hypothetical protein